MSPESRKKAVENALRRFSPGARFDSESAFLRDCVVPLLEALGYSPDEMFFDYVVPWLNDFYRVDLAISRTRQAHPWLLVEGRLNATHDEFLRGLRVLTGLSQA